jgi:Na+/proline symporter
VIIAAPSVILSIVLGWNELTTILVMGLTTTIYTMFGGVQAVTWTDVKQMVVIFVGLSVVLYVIISKFPAGVSLGEAVQLAGATGRLKMVDPSFNVNETYTLWSGLIGGFFLALSYFGCDQSQVQRFLTAKSVSPGAHLAADERLYQNSDAGADPVHRRDGVRVLSVQPAADDFQSG